jgi:hypothetical protein
MTKANLRKTLDQRTLKEVVISMEANLASSGSYLLADVRRLIGDPTKGTGISVPLPRTHRKKR